jgi:hypothetical protein
MFRRFMITVATILTIGVLSGITPRQAAKADLLLQDTARLDGKNIYFTESAGEASRFDRSEVGLSRFAGLLTQLGADLFTLEWRTGFPTDADLIVIAGPATDLSADQVARLWSYMNNGGRLLLLTNPTVETRRALSEASGLFSLMYADMALRGRDDVVVESALLSPADETSVESDAITRASAGNFTTAGLNATHPISAGLDAELAFFIARSLEMDSAIQGYVVTPLVTTTDAYYGETDFAGYVADGTVEFNIGDDRTQGVLPLAAAYDNPRTGSRIVLIGDREFATNGSGLYTSPPNSAGFVYPGNPRFLINTALWLLEADSVDIEFPTPGPTPTVTITPTIVPPTATRVPPTPTPSS